MPTTTDGLPYPDYDDDPDVPGDLQALAEAVDAGYYTKTETYTKAQVDSAVGAKLDASAVSAVITGKTKLHFGSVSDTPNGSGKLTIAHGAPFTPDQIIATVQDSDSGLTTTAGKVVNVASDSIGGTNFDVRVYRNDNANAVTTNVRINWIAMKN